jgi:hypothetical protein
MSCCAIEGCDDVDCPVCSVPRRFAHVPVYVRASELKKNAMAINGTKARPVRDPALIKRKRKALTR